MTSHQGVSSIIVRKSQFFSLKLLFIRYFAKRKRKYTEKIIKKKFTNDPLLIVEFISQSALKGTFGGQFFYTN